MSDTQTPAPADPSTATPAPPAAAMPIRDWTPRVLAIASLLLFYVFSAWVIERNNDLALINLVIGLAGGFVSSGIGYYFGTTAKSAATRT